MKRLSSDQFLRARDFVKSEGRSLERVMFKYEYESGSADDVLMELKKFQNKDGGFGKGLEPDLRCEKSSALATTVALQVLSKVKSNQKNELISDCFRFFVNTYRSEGNGWEIIPREADQYPRAIWWNYSGVTSLWGNPNAEILGYLYEYPELLSRDLLDIKQYLTDYAKNYLLQNCELTEMHEMYCYVRLFERMPVNLRNQMENKLELFVENGVVKNPEERNGYCAVPLQIVDSPESYYYSKYSDVIPFDLDQLIDSQTEDGSWEPNWSWGRFEEEWEHAKKDWKGFITLNNLRILKSFDRIELP